MANDLNRPPKKGRRKRKLIMRLTVPMLLVVLVQILIFSAVLIGGGEFRYVKQYAYNSLQEKTENRRNYIESELQQKVPFVHEHAEKINRLVAEILDEQGASIADLQTDRDLTRSVMTASVDTVVTLLRRSMVNDAYLILETGDLYDDVDKNAKASLYLRDLDPKTDAGYEDLMMETGLTSISRDYGIMLDSGWSLHFQLDPADMENACFYYQTLQTARENSALPIQDLGHWSGFSMLPRNATGSLKYSLPLIAEDGTVYGVIGVGLTENTILSELPANDFMSETACYVLGYDNSDDNFNIVTHSGSSFARLVGNRETLPVSGALAENICDFDIPTDTQLAGSVKYINLYPQNSPYSAQRWALISVADRASVLRPLSFLIQMLIIAVIVSLVSSSVIAVLSALQIVRPISNAIKIMNARRKYSQVIRFPSSNIFELDSLTNAITQLQINVQDFSSQVSKMIRIADMGLGTFMYDSTDDSVFVGQSLLKLLRVPGRQDKDRIMDREVFLESFIAPELRSAVTDGLATAFNEGQEDYTKICSVKQEDGGARWMRVSLIHTNDTSIGILQDITDPMMERKRIEYERDYDSLTGLLNRHAYSQRIEQMFLDKSQLKVAAIVMIDLDNLKYVNDTYGHDFGDDYIKTAATILKRFENFGGIISRISGDEFNVCLPGFSSKDEIRQIIDLVRAKLLEGSCLLADGTHFKIRASIGIAWYPDDSESYEMLMKYADFAMYTIKHSTKGEVAEFDISSYTTDSVLLTGVEEMSRILDEYSVKYAFQCIVSARTGEIYGYEALMRVQSPIFQSPVELLRAAKTGAKLYEVERMTWMKALADFQAQIDAGHITDSSRIFVNSISSSVLEDADMWAIEEAHPQLLSHVVLEILESENADETLIAQKLHCMKKWQAQIALDDFGTGYNSEYALLTIQPNIVKIDRSIISGCDKDVSRRMIINSLVKLARTKHILVLAEGVETEEELRTVIACGVDLLQGYYFTHPLFEPQPLSPEIKALIQHLASPDKEPEHTTV